MNENSTSFDQKLKQALTAKFPNQAMIFRSVRDLILAPDAYLQKTGWVESSLQGRPVDKLGEPVPWMNTFIVDFLKQRLHKDVRTFEYGSGFSTAFYAKKTKCVVSVEYDPEWYAQVVETLPENATVLEQEADKDGDYCRMIHSQDEAFDFVVVDGRDRVNCCKQAVSKLSKAGVILLDDSSRPRYQEAHEFLADEGFRSFTFEGIKPCDVGSHSSTIFYRDGNCLGL